MLINFNKRKNKYYDMLQKYYLKAVEVLQIPCNELEVNVALVNSKTIKRMNAEFRNVDKVTDVLSFPVLNREGENKIVCDILTKKVFKDDINTATGNIMLGDIYICVKKVKQQAKEYGNSFEREFCYLGVHGLLHLLGYDHIEEKDKVKMRTKEEEILGGLKWVSKADL